MMHSSTQPESSRVCKHSLEEVQSTQAGQQVAKDSDSGALVDINTRCQTWAGLYGVTLVETSTAVGMELEHREL